MKGGFVNTCLLSNARMILYEIYAIVVWRCTQSGKLDQTGQSLFFVVVDTQGVG
jgi:hypothetical protein